MSSPTPAPLLDAVLEPFVRAGDDVEARALLDGIVEAHAVPAIRRAVRAHGAFGPRAAGAVEDVEHTVLLRMADHLWRMRRGEESTIGNLAAYAARAAANACYEWLRNERPQRARLQARLRYIFRHHDRLRMWERPGGGWSCGLEAWRDEGRVADTLAGETWRGRLAVPPSAGDAEAEARRLVRLAEAIVDSVGAPLHFEDVVMLAADALGIDDRPLEPNPAGDEPGDVAMPAPMPSVDALLDRRQFVSRVWREIAALPIRQRVALLLNLTGPGGQDLLSLVPASGLASWDEIGTMLGLSSPELRAVVEGLPFDDRAIAERLGLTRRQVINLRKCARERLSRRLDLARPVRRKAAS